MRNRDKRLNVRLTQEERDLLHKVAKEQNMTITDLIIKLFKEAEKHEI